MGREGAARRLRPPHSPHSGLRSGTPVWAGRPRPGPRCCCRRPDGNAALRVRRGMTAMGGSAQSEAALLRLCGGDVGALEIGRD